jgi:hypothetical protein
MKSSYEFINYSIRPAKCIERKMLCDTFRKLSIFAKVETYGYVGFGSTFFSDFSLFHRALNITNMISIEKDEEKQGRFLFNKPYKCINIVFGSSNEILPTLNWETRKIVWLDYDGSLGINILSDVNYFCAKAQPGSVIVVSVNAMPENNPELSMLEMPDYRFKLLMEKIGANRIPAESKPADLGGWGTAKAYRKIISNEIHDSINSRNSGREINAKIHYKQLFNFHYSDGAKMLTTGGILYDEGQTHLVNQCEFDKVIFVRSDENEYKIEVPSLTLKEIRSLNENLPSNEDEELELPSVKPSDINRYRKIYRYFPMFTESNL